VLRQLRLNRFQHPRIGEQIAKMIGINLLMHVWQADVAVGPIDS